MCRHQFHDIIMHSFPDIDEIRCFNNGGPHLHTHICTFIRQHFFYHENICVATISEKIKCIVAEILTKIDVSEMAALICIVTQLPKVVQRTTKLNFSRDPMGL